MANTYLYKAQPGVGSSIKSTFSGWIKLANDNLTGGIYGQYYNSSYLFDICLQNGHLEVADYLVNQYKMRKRTTQKLRDLNAWYHIYVAIDRSLGTAADRTKVYINGERVTDFQSSEDTNYTQQTSGSHDGNCKMNNLGGSSDFSRVGIRYDGNEFDGSMSHIYWVDGSVIDISEFGSTDSTTGEWKINTNPTISSYGQIGFLCLKDGNTITDQSPNSNNFTSSGNGVTKTEDCPSNVFCTMNPLMNYSNGTPTFSKGNNRVDGSGSAWLRTVGTLGARTGKFYYEAKIVTYYGDGRPIRIGWDSIDFPRPGADTYYSGFNISSDGYIRGGIKGYNNYDPNATSLGGSFTGGDFLGFAIDLDNDLITCYKNGTVFTNVNGLDISGNTNCSIKNSLGHQVSPSCNWYAINVNDNVIDFNFGNGAFGNTQLTGTTYNDSQGNGVFKYQPPANYLCWSTKSLNV
jgi:hypothetical protein